MADADTARLCVQIVHSQFGPLAAVSLATDLILSMLLNSLSR